MADQTFRNPDQVGSGSQQGIEKAAPEAKGVADQALSAGRELKDRAAQVAGSSSDAIKEHASDFAEAAKDVASEATDKLKQTVEGQKNAGADYVGSLAETIRRAAREFDSDLPVAGTYIRKAASQVDGVADTIRAGNFKDIVRSAQSFARRQPTAFLGMAVLAGFGVVRFLKSTASPDGSGYPQAGTDRFGASMANRSRVDNAGYRDEFTK